MWALLAVLAGACWLHTDVLCGAHESRTRRETTPTTKRIRRVFKQIGSFQPSALIGLVVEVLCLGGA
jgi:hypothetical protein